MLKIKKSLDDDGQSVIDNILDKNIEALKNMILNIQ